METRRGSAVRAAIDNICPLSNVQPGRLSHVSLKDQNIRTNETCITPEPNSTVVQAMFRVPISKPGGQ
jgi:hypothetical protein